MADNVAITAGSGTVIACDEVVDGTLGTVKVQYVKLMDGTLDGVTKASVGSHGINVAARTRLIAAVGATLTRPANTTPYSIGDAISDNATAASVTAQPVTLSDINDDCFTIERIRVVTNDTALAASHNIRVWVYNSDPTASSGVGGGDNAAYSNKKAGFIGTVSGTFRAGHSDGGVAICGPDEGRRIITSPGSGAKTIWLQYQTLDVFTPSANSTTLIPTVEGYQGSA